MQGAVHDSEAVRRARAQRFKAEAKNPPPLPVRNFAQPGLAIPGGKMVKSDKDVALMALLNAVITWLKLLKYFAAFPHLAMIEKTLSNACACNDSDDSSGALLP